MSVGSLIEEMERKKSQYQKNGTNILFLAAKRPRFRFTTQERTNRIALVTALLDLGKINPDRDISPFISDVDRALWRLGYNTIKDLTNVAKVRAIRQVLTYDRPTRGRPRK